MASSPCPAGESFAYDKIGNMTSKAGVALSYGTTAPKHAVKSHGSTTYTYDANGSMTARGTQTIKYDPEQRPILVKDGASVHRAAYDGDGVRRKREDGNGTVHYLGGYERKLAAGADPEAVTKYYSASFGAMSRLVAFRRAGTLHWVGSDHLGGTIRVLNSSFTALDGMRYKPYGEDRDTGSSLFTDRKFTGQTEDETAGLYWYASRAYDPAIGRFVSPDALVPVPANPQSLNRYSYVYNNPLSFVDPSGHSAEWFSDAWYNEFWEQYGRAPEVSDIVYRYLSMDAASKGQHGFSQQWTNNRAWERPWIRETQAMLQRVAAGNSDQSAVGASIGRALLYRARSIAFPANNPNTFLGNLLGALGGGEPRYDRNGILIYENVGGRVGDFLRGLAPKGEDYQNAVVIGRVVLNTSEFSQLGPEDGARWLAHEYRHTTQYEALGVAYLPLYGLLFLIFQRKGHPMEIDATNYSNLNWQHHQGDVR